MKNLKPLQHRIEKILKYAKHPEDDLSGCTPFAVVRGAPMIKRLSDKMREYFEGVPSKDYDVLMNLYRDSVVESGLEPAYVDHKVFSVVPYYAWTKPIEPNTVTTFDHHVSLFVASY